MTFPRRGARVFAGSRRRSRSTPSYRSTKHAVLGQVGLGGAALGPVGAMDLERSEAPQKVDRAEVAAGSAGPPSGDDHGKHGHP